MEFLCNKRSGYGLTVIFLKPWQPIVNSHLTTDDMWLSVALHLFHKISTTVPHSIDTILDETGKTWHFCEAVW